MRGYGRDYDNRGNWLDRAGETVRGWLGGGRGYDRDYGAMGGDRGEWGNRDWNADRGGSWNRGGYSGGGYAGGERNWSGGGQWAQPRDDDYGMRERMGWGSRPNQQYDRDFGGYGYSGGERDLPRHTQRTYRAGGGQQGRMDGYEYGGGSQGRGMGSDYGSYGGGGDYAAGSGPGYGDYNQGAYGGDLFRNSRGGGVEPGRYYRGYGIGSTGGNGYSPY